MITRTVLRFPRNLPNVHKNVHKRDSSMFQLRTWNHRVDLSLAAAFEKSLESKSLQRESLESEPSKVAAFKSLESRPLEPLESESHISHHISHPCRIMKILSSLFSSPPRLRTDSQVTAERLFWRTKKTQQKMNCF